MTCIICVRHLGLGTRLRHGGLAPSLLLNRLCTICLSFFMHGIRVRSYYIYRMAWNISERLFFRAVICSLCLHCCTLDVLTSRKLENLGIIPNYITAMRSCDVIHPSLFLGGGGDCSLRTSAESSPMGHGHLGRVFTSINHHTFS